MIIEINDRTYLLKVEDNFAAILLGSSGINSGNKLFTYFGDETTQHDIAVKVMNL